MTKRKNIFGLLALIGLLMLIPSVRADFTYAIDSNWASSPPILDGTMDQIYLNKGPQIAWYITPTSAHITGFNYIYILNDATFLYIFVDVVSDNSTDAMDIVYLYLDSDNDETTVIDILEEDRDDANSMNPKLNYTFAISVNGAHNHVQWEIRLRFSLLSDGTPAPGDIVGYLFGVYGTLDPQHYYPANNYSIANKYDEATYNKLQLATAPGIQLDNLTWTLILIGSIAAAVVVTYLLMRAKS